MFHTLYSVKYIWNIPNSGFKLSFFIKPITEQCLHRSALIQRYTICVLILSIISEKLAQIPVELFLYVLLLLLLFLWIWLCRVTLQIFSVAIGWQFYCHAHTFEKKQKKKNIWIVRNGHVNVFLCDRTENLCLRENCEFRSHDQEEEDMFV